MADFTIKKNDDRPDLEAQLKSGGSVVDLSTASAVMFHLGKKPDDTLSVISKAGSITDAGNGKVKYEWATADTDISPRTYYWEFEVEWSNGDFQTFPNDGFNTLQIVAEGG